MCLLSRRVFLNVTAVFAMLVLASFSLNAQQRASLVLVEPVVFEATQNVIEAVGTAEAIRSVTLFPAVAEKVTQVNFVPGQQVKSGDVLVQLDNRRQIIAVQRAEIELADAKRNLERLKSSVARGAVTQSQLDDADTLVSLAEVELEQAKTELEDRNVRAPFDGIVGLTDVEVGDRINLQTPVTTIDDRSQLFVNFNAPESSIFVLNNKPIVELQPWANRDELITAEIAQLDSRVSNDDRTIRARALLQNYADDYRPGMSFKVRMTLLGDRYAAIPEAALSWGAAGAFVWKAENGVAVKVPVQVKQRLRGRILVDGELSEGEMLIAEGIQRLRDGQEISVKTVVAKSLTDSGVAG